MIDFSDLLATVLQNNPARLIVKPNTQEIIAGFGIEEKIELLEKEKTRNFETEVKNKLKTNPIAFSGISFDIFANNDSEKWKDYPLAEFVFPKFAIKFKNKKLETYGNNKGLEKKLKEKHPINSNTSSTKNIFSYSLQDWKELVKKAQKDISIKNIQKIVVAQEISMELGKKEIFDLQNTILSLVHQYNDCVIYVYKNKDSVFFGATPEKIFEYEEKNLSTMALAGTIPNNQEDEKEIEEQFKKQNFIDEHSIVVDFFKDKLAKISKNEVLCEKTKIKKLKNVNHLFTGLKTKYDENNFFKFLSFLHPSPALSGFPISEAKNWIVENEKTDRGWYAGTIGYVEKNNSAFYASLRCATYSKDTNKISAFAGNGIVENCTVESEAKEIKSKFQTIIQSIKIKNATSR